MVSEKSVSFCQYFTFWCNSGTTIFSPPLYQVWLNSLWKKYLQLSSLFLVCYLFLSWPAHPREQDSSRMNIMHTTQLWKNQTGSGHVWDRRSYYVTPSPWDLWLPPKVIMYIGVNLGCLMRQTPSCCNWINRRGCDCHLGQDHQLQSEI